MTRRHRPGNAPYYSAREIADLLGIDPQSVISRAEAEAWPFTGILTGERRRYPTLALPRDVRMAIATGSMRRARERQSKSVLVQWVAE
jgi:hypothetical protein